MEVTHWLEISQEIDVTIGKEELLEAFTEAPGDDETWVDVLNRFALALNALPDAVIAAWPESKRRAVATFLTRHAARFATLSASHAE